MRQTKEGNKAKRKTVDSMVEVKKKMVHKRIRKEERKMKKKNRNEEL